MTLFFCVFIIPHSFDTGGAVSVKGDLRETLLIGYLSILMYRISKGDHHALVADQFGMDRGSIQSLFTNVVTECARISTFCSLIDDKFGFFSGLFDKLIIQLSFSKSPELVDLLQIPGVKVGRARQLFSCGLVNIVDIANSTEGNTQQKAPSDFTIFILFRRNYFYGSTDQSATGQNTHIIR